MKKWTIIGILGLIILSVFLTAYFLKPKTEYSPEECKNIIDNNGDIDIVIFSEEEKAREYSEYFLKQKPFSFYQNFNFYNLNYEPECKLYKNIAILCNSKEVIQKSSSCPNDYIVVIKDKPLRIRSSSYLNIMSINSNHPKSVLLHEFGHSFANLADEYVPANLPFSSKNCVKDCEDFNVGGCYKGCSKTSLFRSIDKGVMRTLKSENYGEFNNDLIEKKLGKSKITGAAIEDLEEEYYLIEGNYTKGEIIILNKSVQKGFLGGDGGGEFSYKIIEKNKTKDTGSFNPGIIFTDAHTNQTSGEVYNYSGIFFLKIPKGDKLIIEKERITEVNLKDINSRPCKK